MLLTIFMAFRENLKRYLKLRQRYKFLRQRYKFLRQRFS